MAEVEQQLKAEKKRRVEMNKSIKSVQIPSALVCPLKGFSTNAALLAARSGWMRT